MTSAGSNWRPARLPPTSFVPRPSPVATVSHLPQHLNCRFFSVSFWVCIASRHVVPLCVFAYPTDDVPSPGRHGLHLLCLPLRIQVPHWCLAYPQDSTNAHCVYQFCHPRYNTRIAMTEWTVIPSLLTCIYVSLEGGVKPPGVTSRQIMCFTK